MQTQCCNTNGRIFVINYKVNYWLSHNEGSYYQVTMELEDKARRTFTTIWGPKKLSECLLEQKSPYVLSIGYEFGF